MLEENRKIDSKSSDAHIVSDDQNNSKNTDVTKDESIQYVEVYYENYKKKIIIIFSSLIYVCFNLILLFNLYEERYFYYFMFLNIFLLLFFLIRGIVSLITECKKTIQNINTFGIFLYIIISLMFLKNIIRNECKEVFFVYSVICVIIGLSTIIFKRTFFFSLKYQRVINNMFGLIFSTLFFILFCFFDCYLCNFIFFLSFVIGIIINFLERRYLDTCLFSSDYDFLCVTFTTYFSMINSLGLVNTSWLDQMMFSKLNSR